MSTYNTRAKHRALRKINVKHNFSVHNGLIFCVRSHEKKKKRKKKKKDTPKAVTTLQTSISEEQLVTDKCYGCYIPHKLRKDL